jgi:hypothetical protein
VTYQVYRGWLTRGLSSWSINKVILSDSFGESYSLCKNFILESGKAQQMTLEPGDCHEEELLRLAETSTTSSTTTTTPSSKETIEVSNRHIPLHRNASSSSSSSSLKGEVKLWKPIVKSRPKNITSSSSVETNEAEPTIELNLGEVLLEAKNKSGGNTNGNEKRSFSNGSDDNNNFAVRNSQFTAAAFVNEPPKRENSMDHEEQQQQQQQQLRERRGGEQITTNSEDSSDENKFVTVQLFQYRLGDVFERAEKYARNTLFPLLSEQISSIFNFESAEGDGGDESTDSPIVIKQNNKKYDEVVPKIDLKSLETMGIKVKSEPIEKVQRKRNFDPKPNDFIFDQTAEASDLSVAAVYVDLPTYRPNTMFKHFIPLLRNIEDE